MPVPLGFGVAFDATCEEIEPGVLAGGTPSRLLRLNDRGREVLRELRTGPVRTAAGGALARRLFDAGLAHPVPPRADADLTVVVPAHDRADLLAECLRALGARFPVLVVDDASADFDAVAKVAADHGARVLRRDVNGGPAAARNTGLAAVDTGLVAFVDSDAVPSATDLAHLAAHLADPAVAAVAPRIVPHFARSVRTTVVPAPQFFGRKPCALDLGDKPAQVAPFTKVSYVPSTVLVARRGVVDGFAETLRYGEDVDLIWRLHAQGHRIRYDPSVEVGHHEPTTWPKLLERRFRYGTSAAPLAKRHPDTFVPLALEPFTAAAVAAAIAGRPRIAALALAAALADEIVMRRQIGLPLHEAPKVVVGRAARTWTATATYATQHAGPVLLAATAVGPTSSGRPSARLAAWLLAEPLLLHRAAAGGRIADDVAYGLGVLAGCVRERTAAPLKPLIRRRRKP